MSKANWNHRWKPITEVDKVMIWLYECYLMLKGLGFVCFLSGGKVVERLKVGTLQQKNKTPCKLFSAFNVIKHQILKFIRLLAVLVGIVTIFSVSANLNISEELLKKIEIENGEDAVKRIQQWQDLMRTRKALSELEKLNLVNDFFNQKIEFANDRLLWNVKDYWATPLESLSKGAGDCEDYTIAKYFTLLELGIPENKMRLTYVKALRLNQAHMVLTYFSSPRAIPVVLDNLNNQIKKATLRTDLLPVYSFNGSGLWLTKFGGKGKKLGSSDRLNLWNKLKVRMLDYHAQ